MNGSEDVAPILIWDLPIRLFHWSLVVLIPFSYVSIRLEWLELHMLSGYFILTLLLFRLLWGVIGSDTARFSQFLRVPREVLAHFGELRHGAPDHDPGHNPAGGWMVVFMLALLGLQTVTGLGSNDDLFNEGPLAKYLGKHLSDRVSIFHAWNFNIILAAVGLHVLAVAAYALRGRGDLVAAMLTGRKRLPLSARLPNLSHPLMALAILGLSGILVFGISRL